MFPPNQGQGQLPPNVNLEDHLRGMILGNATSSPSPNHDQTSSTSSRIHNPPHGRMPSSDDQFQHVPQQAPAVPQVQNNQPSPKAKRPNQAQRRQMNPQMDIPIDTRSSQGVPFQRNQNQNTRGFSQHQNNQRSSFQQHSYPQQQQPFVPPYLRQEPPPQNFQRTPGTFQPPPSQYIPRNQNQFHSSQQNSYGRPPPQNRQLYQPSNLASQTRHDQGPSRDDILIESSYLERISQACIPNVGIDSEEQAEKNAFRSSIEKACQEAIAGFERDELNNESFDPSTVQLQCFGSMMSGFATKASDMDLALLTPDLKPAADSPESHIPRLLEKKLLSLGYGARLLTRTRVPIIKLCQKPTEKLLADLLKERAKWEKGIVPESIGEDHEPETPTQDVHGEADPKSPISLTSPQPHTEPCDLALSSLKQKDGQDILGYYTSAKRLLRKLGGRDIIPGSNAILNAEESKILQDVCKAFILGLASESLSTRLQTYASVKPLFDSTLPFLQRTIFGVWTQAEGTRLVLAWESDQIQGVIDLSEQTASRLVSEWEALQQLTGTSATSLRFNKQLLGALDQLKLINSLKLLFLEQSPFEEPANFKQRTERLTQLLRGDNLDAALATQYVTGINNEKIRDQIRLHCTVDANTTLQEIGILHQRLQLAEDYDRALGLKAFQDEDVEDVNRYMHLLRVGTTEDLSGPTHSELFAKMRRLPDPTRLSLLKPRDRYKDHLEFPKTNIGIQCDINFSADLAIHNTLLLRCYSLSDPRVKPMILFVKHWAKVRGINTPYRGSLSSYGYVLMVLHYLVNIAQSFVCPNLQLSMQGQNQTSGLSPSEIEAQTTCKGHNVRFWRHERDIKDLADRKLLNHNHDSLGFLLRGFFEYYATPGMMSTVNSRAFDWGREVLSLRTRGGILSKQEKGWVGAKTVIETNTIAAPTPTSKPAKTEENNPISTSLPSPDQDGNSTQTSTTKPAPTPTPLPPKTISETKEIRHRYLFAIEDPFELDHNVARTVTHPGIVAIRDEFRRAWRIIRGVARNGGLERESLLEVVGAEGSTSGGIKYAGGNGNGGIEELMDLLHGKVVK